MSSVPPVHPDILPIGPDDDAPVREGWKVVLHDGPGGRYGAFAFFPDSTYGTSDAALAAADAWCQRGTVDESDTRNVVRIDIEPRPADGAGPSARAGRRATHGWQVRMQRQGVTYTQFFNDQHFGGRAGALAAARGWRDTRETTLVRTDPREALDRSRDTRSQFGVPGLRLLLIDVGGRRVPSLQASWPETRPDATDRRKRVTLSLERSHPKEVTARLCRMLVEARGTAALPSGSARATSRVQVPDPHGLGDDVAPDVRVALHETYREAYRRAWPAVRRELPYLRARAAQESSQTTDSAG